MMLTAEPEVRPLRAFRRSAQAEHRHQGFVYRPQFGGGQTTDAGSDSPDVDRTDVLDENPRALASHLRLRAKRRRPSTTRRRRYEDHRAGKELVGLNDDSESCTLLLGACALWNPEPMNITSAHARTP